MVVLLVAGCKSAAEKACFDSSKPSYGKASQCGEECDRGNGAACAQQTKIGTDGCMTAKDVELCRWMCDNGHAGKDLYCAEYKKLTGHEADEIPMK